MKEYKCDLAIIGSGPAGEKAAIEASSSGKKIIVIEKALKPGGAGEISGTIPSKSIRETVQFITTLTRNEIQGISKDIIQNLTIKDLMQRKNEVVSRRVDEIFANYKNNNIEYICGKASFVSEHEIKVQCPSPMNNSLVKADKILIAVGTKPYNPPDINFDRKLILDSDSILELDEIPKEIAIYGGGVIGCEYASIFSKLGAKVHLIDPRERLLTFIDGEISHFLTEYMRKTGIILHFNQSYKEISIIDEKVMILLQSGKKIHVPKLLYANGREGQAKDLNLSQCGLNLNKRNQLEVNEFFQTECSHIYAAGDIIGFPSLVSVSNEEGRRAMRHAIFGEKVSRVTSDIPSAIYTIPEIAMIGKTAEELKNDGLPFETGICHFKDLAKGLILGETEGILKILFNKKTGKILGIHLMGHLSSELIHIGQAVMELAGTIYYFMEKVMNFPTLASAYKVAARNGLSSGGEKKSKIPDKG